MLFLKTWGKINDFSPSENFTTTRFLFLSRIVIVILFFLCGCAMDPPAKPVRRTFQNLLNISNAFCAFT